MNKNDVIDKLKLIAIVVSSLAAGVLLQIYFGHRMSQKWTNFIIDMGIIYPIMLVGLTFGYGDFRRYSRIKLLFYQGTYYCITFGTAFLIFKHGLLPMPTSNHLYIAGAAILALASMLILSWCVRNTKFFRIKRAKR